MNFFIEANIGAGKSTLVKNVASILNEVFNISVETFTEPVELWANTPQGNLLAMFGRDPKSYAFSLQTLVMATLR